MSFLEQDIEGLYLSFEITKIPLSKFYYFINIISRLTFYSVKHYFEVSLKVSTRKQRHQNVKNCLF